MDDEFLRIRKERWREAKIALNIKYTPADDYFVKYFGTPTFNKAIFRKLIAEYGISV